MNYVQIEIGGKLRGWKANQMTVEIFSQYILDKGNQSSAIYAAMYAGLMANCYIKREEPDFSFEDVCDWVDDLYVNDKTEAIKQVDDCFTASMAYKKMLDAIQDKLRILDEQKKTPVEA